MRGHVMRNCRARNCRVLLPVLLVLLAATTAARTQATFAGKTVTMYIGFGPGGGYDLWARVVARHIGAHLPGNPTVVPQNLKAPAAIAPRTSSTTWRRRTAPPWR